MSIGSGPVDGGDGHRELTMIGLRNVRRNLIRTIGGALLFGCVFFVVAVAVSARGIRESLSAGLFALALCSLGAASMKSWVLGQMVWNQRHRRAIATTVTLVSSKSNGVRRGTWVRLNELGLDAKFGRTTFAWVPAQFVARGEAFVFGTGRYSVIVSLVGRPIAATLQHFESYDQKV